MTRNFHVLLIDDDVFHRELLAEGLGYYSEYDVATAEGLEDADRMLAERKPNLIVLDCVLGGNRHAAMDWAERLRRTDETPILFVTAYYQDMKPRVRDIEHSEILGKPFDLEEVTHMIRRLLAD